MGVWCPHTDQISNCNWNAAPDDENATPLQFIGIVDLNYKRNGPQNEDWDSHVVDFE